MFIYPGYFDWQSCAVSSSNKEQVRAYTFNADEVIYSFLSETESVFTTHW